MPMAHWERLLDEEAPTFPWAFAQIDTHLHTLDTVAMLMAVCGAPDADRRGASHDWDSNHGKFMFACGHHHVISFASLVAA